MTTMKPEAPEAGPVNPALVSEEEFLQLPETMTKTELLDGEVIVSAAPSHSHQQIILRLSFELRTWALTRSETVTIGLSPEDIRFAPGRILQPDLYVAFEKAQPGHRGPLPFIPALCIEVLSTDRVYDRVTKRGVYAGAGVQEFWAVEQAGPIERYTGEGLTQCTIHDKRLSTPLLPGFELDLERLFAEE